MFISTFTQTPLQGTGGGGGGTPASIFQSSDQEDGRAYRRDGEGETEKQQQLRFGKGRVPLS